MCVCEEEDEGGGGRGGGMCGRGGGMCEKRHAEYIVYSGERERSKASKKAGRIRREGRRGWWMCEFVKE